MANPIRQYADGRSWGDSATHGETRPALTVVGGEMNPARAAESNAIAARPKAIAWVRMAPDILRAMAQAANHAGRNVGDVWAEAAREWLLRKTLEADYDVLAYSPARRKEEAALEEKRTRLWGSIDTAMAGIRAAELAR